MAVAKVEFACDTIVPGDYAIPFEEKPAALFHAPMRFDLFAPSNGQLSGRIILGKDFDSEMGSGGKVYLNVGANQGLKLGDFVRATRTYEVTAKDPVESLSFAAAVQEPTQDAADGDRSEIHEPRRRAGGACAGDAEARGGRDSDYRGDSVNRNRNDCFRVGASAYRRPGGVGPAVSVLEKLS